MAYFSPSLIRPMAIPATGRLSGTPPSISARVEAQTLAWLRDELEWIHLGHGDVLFREGDPSEAMYLVVSGRLRISTSSPDDGQRTLGEVSPGEIVGELGLLGGEAVRVGGPGG